MTRSRAHLRSLALDLMRIGYLGTGRVSRATRQPGTFTLLLHNTMGSDGDSLVNYVDRHRDRLVDFDTPLPGSRNCGSLRISLTFDDGFKSNLAVARALSDRDLKACFYVPTDVIGLNKSDSDTFFGRPQVEGVMDWDDLEELTNLGHAVGSHCRQHKALSSMSTAEAEDQVKGSIAVLRARLGRSDHFAWPFGSLAHAPVDYVLRWCADISVVPASGVRGVNTLERFAAERYFRRDAVSLARLERDIQVFSARGTA